MKETKTLEFKETTKTNSFLKTVSAFANYSDGKIIFGICDDGTTKEIDNPNEACLDLENKLNDSIKPIPFYTLEINDDNTITLEVKKGMYTPYLYKGKAYKRNDTATIEIDRLELNRLVLEGMNQTYEEQVSYKQDLTFLQLEKELSEKLGTNQITTDILKTLGLIKKDKYNNAAALIADKNEYPGIDIVRFGKNINELMNRSMCDNVSIFQMYHHAMEFYEMYYTYEKIEGSKRVKKELIPSQAYREALANALVHRLWDINSRIRISMFEDRIEISSPGGLPFGLDKEEYLNGQISNLRNPILGNIFFRLNYIEMFGSGIKRIKAAYDDSLSKPEFNIFNNSIEIKLPVVKSRITFTDDEQAIIDILSTSQKISRLQLEEKTGFTKSKTIRLLASLNDKGIILKSGSGPNIKYYLNKK
ncbi:MAG: ATP-binding protein [Floccifex sp.]